MKRVFTNSEMACYQDCPKKYWFRYNQKLEVKSENNNLRFGTLIHEGLYEYYQGKNIDEVLVNFIRKISDIVKQEEDEEKANEIYEFTLIGGSMLERYAKYSKEHDDFKIIDSELRLQVPISAPSGRASTVFEFSFKCDQIIEINNKYWIHEFKTAKIIASDYIANLVLDEQMTRYCWALEKHLGKEIEGVVYTILRKKIPVIPGLLQKGGLSKASNIDTTYEVYLQAIKNNNLIVEDYKDILDRLQTKGETFIIREMIMRNKQEKKLCEERLYTLCKVLNTDTPVYMCPNRDCIWKCPYRILCISDSPEARSTFITKDLTNSK